MLPRNFIPPLCHKPVVFTRGSLTVSDAVGDNFIEKFGAVYDN